VAKKNFKSGLEDLFNDAMEGNIAKNVSEKMATKKPSSKSKKSFSSGLESLFEEAITETTIESAQATKDGKKSKGSTKRSKPAFGIDSLICETVETSKIERVTAPEGKKRVTITFDKEKLEKLKKIARLQKSYLKDIVNEVVGEYISEFESSKKG
jgi:hypothetical protein